MRGQTPCYIGSSFIRQNYLCHPPSHGGLEYKHSGAVTQASESPPHCKLVGYQRDRCFDSHVSHSLSSESSYHHCHRQLQQQQPPQRQLPQQQQLQRYGPRPHRKKRLRIHLALLNVCDRSCGPSARQTHKGVRTRTMACQKNSRHLSQLFQGERPHLW